MKKNDPNLKQDKSDLGGAHTPNCMADFMKTSWMLVKKKFSLK